MIKKYQEEINLIKQDPDMQGMKEVVAEAFKCMPIDGNSSEFIQAFTRSLDFSKLEEYTQAMNEVEKKYGVISCALWLMSVAEEVNNFSVLDQPIAM